MSGIEDVLVYLEICSSSSTLGYYSLCFTSVDRYPQRMESLAISALKVLFTSHGDMPMFGWVIWSMPIEVVTEESSKHSRRY